MDPRSLLIYSGYVLLSLSLSLSSYDTDVGVGKGSNESACGYFRGSRLCETCSSG